MVLKASHGFDRACLLFLSGSSNCGDSGQRGAAEEPLEDVGTWSLRLCGLVGLWNLFSDI